MAISLNNHESRIKALENKIGTSMSDTGWINGTLSSIVDENTNTSKVLRYRIMNGVVYLELGGFIRSTGWATVGTLVNWKYGKAYFHFCGGGDRGGTFEGKTGYIETDGILKINCNQQYTLIGRGTSVFPLTIYYIVRYNIYKLVRFLSHLNTKFGGERR